MSQFALYFTTDNTLSSISAYRIISYEEAFENIISISSVEDIISNETASYNVQRSFRYSKDGINWSLWINFTIADQTPIQNIVFDPSLSYFLDFKYTVVAIDGVSPELPAGTVITPSITIDQFDIFFELNETDPFEDFVRPVNGLCSSEFSNTPVLFQENFTFNPYDVGRGVALYQDLSKIVNNVFGHEVNYYRIVPQQRSRDVVLKEWTIYQVEQEKCIKVLVPNNEFPDSKLNFNQFGIDFEQPFEIHIDKGYWEGIFGKGTMPQKRDVIYFKLTNRIYEIQSAYIFKDFMQQPLYFKASLVKYQPKADTIDPLGVKSGLDEIIITTEALFGDEVKEEIEKITKPQQYATITHESDPVRQIVLRTLRIDKSEIYNNWTLVAETLYNMTQSFIQYDGVSVEAVRYRLKAKQEASDNRAFTCWFQPILNSKNSETIRPLLRGRNSAGLGVDIDLMFVPSGTSQIVLTINSTVYSFDLQSTLIKENWYAIVVNWSNEFGQASVDLWNMKTGTSQLVRISHELKTMAAEIFDEDFNYSLWTSSLNLTNIRLFDQMIADEAQNIVLNQLIVRDSDMALLIDNSKVILRLAQIGFAR